MHEKNKIKIDEITSNIELFKRHYSLDDKNISYDICRKLYTDHYDILTKGKIEAWACGIVHSIIVSNKDIFNNIKIKDIYNFFNVSQSTGLDRSKKIRDKLKVDNFLISNDNSDIFKIEKDNFEKAQRIVANAYLEKNFNKKLKYAKDALDISPHCSDAYIILANDNKLNYSQKEELLRKAVDESLYILNLGDKSNIEEDHIFRMKENQGYIATQYILALHLWDGINKDEAINILSTIIKNDKNDTLNIRGILSSFLIIKNKKEELRQLLKDFKNDYLTSIIYNKVLFSLLDNDYISAKLHLKRAIKYNPYVPNYILKFKKCPNNLPVIKSYRSEEEAMHYMKYGFEAWNKVSGAIELLKEIR